MRLRAAAEAGADQLTLLSTGIEFQQGSADAEKFSQMLKDNFPDRFKKARCLLMRVVRCLPLTMLGCAGPLPGLCRLRRQGCVARGHRAPDGRCHHLRAGQKIQVGDAGAQGCAAVPLRAGCVFYVYALLIVVCVQATS